MNPLYVTQSTIGKWFGVSSIKVGKILTTNGLKDKNGATQSAVKGGYAKPVTTKDQLTFYVWDAIRTSLILDEALADIEKPYIDGLVAQVGESLEEADRCRAEGSYVLADLIEEQATEGVPPGLVGLIRARFDIRPAESARTRPDQGEHVEKQVQIVARIEEATVKR